MDFNHLFSEKELKIANRNGKCGCCYWLPASEGAATAANNVVVQMYCKNCDARSYAFLHLEEYELHNKVITEEVNRVKTRK